MAVCLVRAFVDSALSIALAPCCAACRQPLDSPTRGAVCTTCLDSIVPLAPPYCGICGGALSSWRTRSGDACARCRATRSPLTTSRALGQYDGALRAMLHALKYDGRRTIASRLSRMMQTRCRAVLAGADAVVPVPLHWRRRRVRGFNQAEDLAAGLGLPVLHALRRRRHTRTQTDLPAAERHANVRHAFVVRRRVSVRDLCLVVVDDVRTTGATIDACARVLKEAGAREVRGLTAAAVATPWSDGPRRRPRLSNDLR